MTNVLNICDSLTQCRQYAALKCVSTCLSNRRYKSAGLQPIRSDPLIWVLKKIRNANARSMCESGVSLEHISKAQTAYALQTEHVWIRRQTLTLLRIWEIILNSGNIKKNKVVDKTLNKMTITTGRPTQKKARTAAQTDHILWWTIIPCQTKFNV